jgi:hypothetical protein
MSRLTFGTAMVLPVLGASLALAFPISAHAATTHAPYTAARPDDEVVVFTGHTYPGTAAGLAACEAEGKVYEASGAGVTDCWLGEPDAGLYGLYMVRTIP